MRPDRLLICAIAAAMSLPPSARAEVDLAAFHTCVDSAIAEGTPAADCMHKAQADCMVLAPEQAGAAATVCFLDATDAWNRGIRARLDAIQAKADPKLAAAIGIEVKYDLLASLLQCDRMEELALLGDGDVATIAPQKARCEATAAGLALTKLILHTHGLK